MKVNLQVVQESELQVVQESEKQEEGIQEDQAGLWPWPWSHFNSVSQGVSDKSTPERTWLCFTSFFQISCEMPLVHAPH